MGVSGLVSRSSRAARMPIGTAGQVTSQGNSVVGVRGSVRPVDSVLTCTVHSILMPGKPTATRGEISGGAWHVDTVGVPGDWGYR